MPLCLILIDFDTPAASKTSEINLFSNLNRKNGTMKTMDIKKDRDFLEELANIYYDRLLG